jgi:hypothetical protein
LAGGSGIGEAYAIRLEPRLHERPNPLGDDLAQGAYRCVIAPSGFHKRRELLLASAEVAMSRVGLTCAQHGLVPHRLEVGQCGADLLLWALLLRLDLTQHGKHLAVQPALLGVGVQQKPYV